MTLKSLGLAFLATAIMSTSASALERNVEFGSDRLPADLLRRTAPVVSQQVLTAAIKSKGCTFFEHINGGGASWKVNVDWIAYDGGAPRKNIYGQALARVGPWWNDKISSVKCDNAGKLKCVFVGYEHVDFGGRYSSSGMKGNVVNLTPGFNDMISSLKVFCSELW